MSSRLLVIALYLVAPYIIASLYVPVQPCLKYRACSTPSKPMGALQHSGTMWQTKSAPYSRTQLNLAHTISLDTAVLSGSKFGLQKFGFCILLMTLVGKRFYKSMTPDAESGSDDRSKSTSSKALTLRNLIQSFFAGLDIFIESLSTKFASSVEFIKSKVSSVFGLNKGENIKLDDWNVCKLQLRESLYGGRYTRYRFELENSAAKLPLYIGQEVSRHVIFIIKTSMISLTS